MSVWARQAKPHTFWCKGGQTDNAYYSSQDAGSNSFIFRRSAKQLNTSEIVIKLAHIQDL